MSRYCDLQIAPILDAADRWKKLCLVEGRSVFTGQNVWAPDVFEELKACYIDAPDMSSAGYYDKLKGQLAKASDRAKWLAVELTWVLYLFPHGTIGPATKRRNLELICSNAGLAMPNNHWALETRVLAGIGGTGTFFNTGFWFELSFALLVFREFMKLNGADREKLVRPDGDLSSWFDSLDLPQKLATGDTLNPRNRQARHVLLFLLQPDRYERIASSGHKRKIVTALARKIGIKPDVSSPSAIDAQLLAIRKYFETELKTPELDYYRPPLKEMWDPQTQSVQQPVAEYLVEDGVKDQPTWEPDLDLGLFPRNVIFFGPPGTGKTWTLMNRILVEGLYSESIEQEPEGVRLARIAREVTWYEVIAAALIDADTPLRVPQIKTHRFIEAKLATGATPKNVSAQIWGMLQLHTSPESKTVKTSIDKRFEPFVFDKDDQSRWSLVPGFELVAPELTELYEKFKKSNASVQKVRRYRFVTFHPSYAYEDFVEGLRPVEVEREDGTIDVQIKPRDGALKLICKAALADPAHRYALVIDEINRGNIAKIFGELITLIEPDKRLKLDSSGIPEYAPGCAVILPTSQEWFGVPENVDFYGTMNTSDRSIALVDIALRRRFVFRELLPNSNVISGEHNTGTIPTEDNLNRIDLRRTLEVLNARLTVLRGRDTCIGHAYLCEVKTVDQLRAAFRDRIIPLLQEHFYEDWEGVAMVLAVAKGATPFVEKVQPKIDSLFGAQVADMSQVFDRPIWRVARALRADAQDDDVFPDASFRALYEGVPTNVTDLD